MSRQAAAHVSKQQSDNFHAQDAKRTLEVLGVRSEQGLSADEADRRLIKFGPNLLRAKRRRTNWAIFVDQFRSLLTLLLGVATAISFAVGDYAEGAAIIAVILVNVAIGFFSERKAVSSIEALRQLGAAVTRVRRDSLITAVPAEHLVPGDIVLLEAGDVIAADLRLIAASGLECDESLLTGESVPVQKSVGPVGIETPISERTSMAFKGTAVTRGVGEGIVIATGRASELGAIAKLVEEADDEITPLEQRLERMSRQLIWVALGIAALVLLIGVAGGRDTVLMVKTGIALAIAAIPEGLPIVATLALARGMWRLARRNALVERLSAVETLGSVTVIFTDKTGTLTENRMTVTELVLNDGAVRFQGDQIDQDDVPVAVVARAAAVFELCTSAELHDATAGTGVGDPMEIALLHAARKLAVPTDVGTKIGEEAFDPQIRMMAAVHQEDDERLITVKGAPEAVLAETIAVATAAGDRPITEAEKTEWAAKTRELASKGQRVLALADKRTSDTGNKLYEGLTWLGLVALEDPPRADARAAVEAARRAGIKVVMITGDNAITGASIAHSVGLTDGDNLTVVEGKDLRDVREMSEQERRHFLETPVFARFSPKQKLGLIALYQDAGEIVAMTGDGVNDAPALKKADIGIAMGLRGTQVAKEAADLILKDDAFASTIAAIRQGRVIFTNIRKFVFYLMSCNVSEVLVVAIGTASGLPLPLLPLQILFLNLVTDVFPALALGAGEGDRDVLDRPPRDPEEPIMTHQHWVAVGVYGIIITASVLAAFVWATLQDDKHKHYPVTVAFLTIAFAQLWHVFNMRSRLSSPIDNQVIRNPFIWAALALCGTLLLAAVYLPQLAISLHLVPPDAMGWTVIIGASLMPLLAGQLIKAVRE